MWPNPQFPQFPEEILNGKLHFLCSAIYFSSVLIQIKVIGQDLGLDRDLWEAKFFTKCYKTGGQCNKREKLAFGRISNSLRKFK